MNLRIQNQLRNIDVKMRQSVILGIKHTFLYDFTHLQVFSIQCYKHSISTYSGHGETRRTKQATFLDTRYKVARIKDLNRFIFKLPNTVTSNINT